MHYPQAGLSSGGQRFFSELALMSGALATANGLCGASRVKVALLVASGSAFFGLSQDEANLYHGRPTLSLRTRSVVGCLAVAPQLFLFAYDLKDCFSLFRWPSKQRLALLAVDLCRYGWAKSAFARHVQLERSNSRSIERLCAHQARKARLIETLRIRDPEELRRRKGDTQWQKTRRQVGLQLRIQHERPRICWAPLLKRGRSNEALVLGTRVPDLVIKRVMQQMSPYLLMTKVVRVNRQWLRLASEVLVEKLEECHPLTDPRFADYRTRYQINVYPLPELTPVTLWSHHLPALKGSVPFWKGGQLHVARPSTAFFDWGRIYFYIESMTAVDERRREELRNKLELLSWLPNPGLVKACHPLERVPLLKYALHCRGTFERGSFHWDADDMVDGITEEHLKMTQILLDGGAEVVPPKLPRRQRNTNYAKLLLLLEGKPLTKSNVRKRRVKSLFR